MSHVILIANDNLLKVNGVTNAQDGTFQNNATVQATLKDESGTDVSGQTWPLSLAFVTSSNGNYTGILDDALVLKAGKKYIAEITITLAGGSKFFAEKKVTAQDRSI